MFGHRVLDGVVEDEVVDVLAAANFRPMNPVREALQQFAGQLLALAVVAHVGHMGQGVLVLGLEINKVSQNR